MQKLREEENINVGHNSDIKPLVNTLIFLSIQNIINAGIFWYSIFSKIEA